MRARIVKIGNSQGIRIPKIILEQAHLNDEVELKVQENELVIHSPRKTRAGWAEAFRDMANRGEDKVLDGSLSSLTRWDVEEWEW